MKRPYTKREIPVSKNRYKTVFVLYKDLVQYVCIPWLVALFADVVFGVVDNIVVDTGVVTGVVTAVVVVGLVDAIVDIPVVDIWEELELNTVVDIGVGVVDVIVVPEVVEAAVDVVEGIIVDVETGVTVVVAVVAIVVTFGTVQPRLQRSPLQQRKHNENPLLFISLTASTWSRLRPNVCDKPLSLSQS